MAIRDSEGNELSREQFAGQLKEALAYDAGVRKGFKMERQRSLNFLVDALATLDGISPEEKQRELDLRFGSDSF